MSTLKIDELKNNGSAIDLPNGIKVGGNEIVQGYTSSGTEPASPAKGDFWWDSTNELLYQYVNGEFKEIGIVVPSLDVSAFTYDNVSFRTADSLAHCGIAFSTDGTSLYAVGSVDDTIYQYSMTAWDLSTAAYASKLKNVSSQETSPRGLVFKPDGTIMYIVGRDNNRVYQYSLSTAWDVSTASYTVGDNFSTASQDTVGMAVSFSADGLKMIVSGSSTDSVHQYSLSTAWTVNTASYDNVSFSLSSQNPNVSEGFLSPDQAKFYTIDGGTSDVYQYSTNF